MSLLQRGVPSLRKAIAYAETASNTKDWPESENRWQAVLERFDKNEEAAGRARLNISVARRLTNINAYNTSESMN